MKTTLLAAILALPLLVSATAESFAWSKSFQGTRDQVRAACAKAGGDLSERAGSTSCASLKTGNHVTCSHTGQCEGGGPGPMPRVRTGMIDLGLILDAGGKAAPDPWQVPQSLTSSGGSGGSGDTSGAPGAETPSGGGGSGGDIGQWHASGAGSPGQIN